METAMGNKARNTSGKFAAKSETPRKIRSVNLTDDAWQWLADVATQSGVSRNDYLEAMAVAEGIPLMETVNTRISPLIETVKSDNVEIAKQRHDSISPFIETVSHALITPEEALAHSAIYGFTPEEALADAHFQISMLESNHDELEDRHESVKREYAKLLESSTAVTAKLREETAKVRSQLETERADREEVERQLSDRESEIAEVRSELSDLKQKSATAEKDLPEAADILDQLRKAKGKKFTASLADVESILGILEKS